jgi:hypothetical protein
MAYERVPVGADQDAQSGFPVAVVHRSVRLLGDDPMPQELQDLVPAADVVVDGGLTDPDLLRQLREAEIPALVYELQGCRGEGLHGYEGEERAPHWFS